MSMINEIYVVLQDPVDCALIILSFLAYPLKVLLAMFLLLIKYFIVET